MAGLVFEWDDDNTAHIALHQITIDEAKTVIRSVRNKVSRSRSSGLPITFGRTRTGKDLAVIWVQVGSDPTRVRVVAAYEVDKPGGGS